MKNRIIPKNTKRDFDPHVKYLLFVHVLHLYNGIFSIVCRQNWSTYVEEIIQSFTIDNFFDEKSKSTQPSL